ncbi:modular serine protease-like [Contarinia nasturtii]|uniref:modular serine protease-like n=1 Tax=Contarinia nasturtii TaxID=265458 RepID=UPI0012D47468|nr:modular serine protease-like [Contarinia nasturtii]
MYLFNSLIFSLSILAVAQSARVANRNSFVPRTIQCTAFEWKCDNGQCIDSSEVCDGIANCSDGSDETTDNCIATTCPRYAFRCNYGACVAGNAECNRKIECLDGSDEATEKCPTKTQEQLQGSCNRNSFQCDNGDCINVEYLCDGAPECSDSSDESVRYCASTHCPSYAFRCGTGGCISGKKKCDNRIDCILDGSDENWALCGKRKNESLSIRPPVVQVNTSQRPVNTFQMSTTFAPTSNIDSCRADNIPVNGDAYYQYDTTKKVLYGEIVENFVSINYKCIENHELIGNGTNICIGGRWQSQKPQCKPRCSASEIQGVTISANCFSIVNNTQKSTSCVRPVEPGTLAYVSCQRGYEKIGPQQTLTCREDGRWSPTPQRCTQICGEINEGTAYIVGGSVTTISRIPWHAGIYRKNSYDGKYSQICGGTIITSKVIISAMHCFWDASEDRPFRADAFLVAVGKTLRDFSVREDHKPQFFVIEHIFYIDGYNDLAGSYANDIALLVVDKHIEFHSFIVPICLPQNLQYADKNVEPGWRGFTAGWGLEASNGQPSPVLKKIELPVVSREECKDKSSPEFANFITSDKFCAGHLTGVSVCQGDSGGGLVFPQTVRQKTTYTLRGIVSTGGNKAGSCDNDKYTTFTNVAHYMEFINAHISKYEPKY